ncbi:MAG: dihydrodipicolinate synthase family protein [Terriglobia bacterium]|nr:dihydrodipicolinate synthase family protein [Terriglobia bacterium]
MHNNVGRGLKDELRGVLPPATVPFDEKGEIAFEGLHEQIDFLIGSGASAVVVGGSTGEGHTLSNEEFKRVVTEACKATAGRVPFVTGLIVNSTHQAIERVKMLRELKICALQVTPVHYLFKPDTLGTIDHFRTIWEQIKIPIIIYNVIPWNYLSVDMMLQIMDEVPGVVGIKQSSGDLKSVSDLLLRANPNNLILTGIDALLYPAFMLGATGAITALTSAVPGAVVSLYKAVQRGDHTAAKDMHFRLNALWNVIPHDNLPACVKYIQHLQGIKLYQPRLPMAPVSDPLKAAIDVELKNVLCS